MPLTIVRTAEQPEYLHHEHHLFFVRDVIHGSDNSHMSLHRGRIEPNGEITAHCHENMATVYILSGDVICTMNDEEARLGSGSCVVIPGNVVRSFNNCGDQPVEMLLMFTPPLA